MRHIGSFGAPLAQAEVVAFDWLGKTFRSSPTLGELDYVDFMAGAAALDVNDPVSLAVVKDFARSCVHPDDFAEFWRLARANRQGSVDIFKVCTAIVEAVTDRPTVQPSGSSDGLPSTPPSSEGGESLQVQREFEEQGRADLALMVKRQREFSLRAV